MDRIRRHLEREGHLDAAAIERVDQELNDEISRAIDAVEKLPPPPLDSVFDDVYAGLPWHLVEQRDELRRGPRAPSGH